MVDLSERVAESASHLATGCSTRRRSIAHSSAAVLCFLVVLVPTLYAMGLVYLRAYFWSQPYPYNSFLPIPSALADDFNGTQYEWVAHHFYGVSTGLVYFPATYLPLQGFEAIFGSSIYPARVLSAVAFLVVCIAAIGWLLHKQGWAVTALGMMLFLISYPTLFALYTGNLESWVGALLLVMTALHAKGRRMWAAAFLGYAVAMKGIPIAFLPVLWLNRSFRESLKITGTCVAVAFGSTLIALVALPGGILHGFGVIENLRASQRLYANLLMFGIAGTHYGNSFLNGIHAFFGEKAMPSRQWWLPVLLIGGALFVVAVLYLLKAGAPLWMMLALSASAGCLLVPTSADYKLLYFIPAIVSLLSEARIARSWIPGAVLLCFIVTPKPWGLRPADGDPFHLASVYLTPLLMILLCIWAVGWNWFQGHDRHRTQMAVTV